MVPIRLNSHRGDISEGALIINKNAPPIASKKFFPWVCLYFKKDQIVAYKDAAAKNKADKTLISIILLRIGSGQRWFFTQNVQK